MGKSKTDRTEQLRQAARRYTIAQEAQGHIEQHKFDRLVAQGIIVKGGGLEKALPPMGPGLL